MGGHPRKEQLMNVYVLTARVYNGTMNRWVVGVYADNRTGEIVARGFEDLDPQLHVRTVDMRSPQELSGLEGE
jgi:hypothetical protein